MWPQICPNFDYFHQKMAYFDQIDTINDTFHQSYVNNSEWNNFWDGFKTIFSPHHKILTYDNMLAPKTSQFWAFSPRMTYFEKDPVNQSFDQSYVNKPVWKNFSQFLEKKFVHHFPQILTYALFLDPKITLFWQNCPH